MKNLKIFFKRWKDFSGTSDRTEFWWGYFEATILLYIFAIFEVAIAAVSGFTSELDAAIGIPLAILCLIINFFNLFVTFWICIAMISAQIRRLRDAGFPWWFIFASLILGVGQIALIVCECLPSSDVPRVSFGNNQQPAQQYPASNPAPVVPVVAQEPVVQPAEGEANENTKDVPVINDGSAPVENDIPIIENNTWVCPNCAFDGNEGNFCGKCGLKKPE